MVKYVATAAALKAFSAGPQMRRLYRRLGNRMGNSRRMSGPMPSYYVDRVQRILRILTQHPFVRDGDRIIELGTGWLHWEALTLRLLFDIESVLFDVWDNRQLGALKNYVRQLVPLLKSGLDLTPVQRSRAVPLAEKVVEVESFDELYQLLNCQYVIESSGSLDQFESGSFQLVVSGGVLEHVKREGLPHLAAATYRILKPGGWALHSIDSSDHLSHYDSSVCKKKYLSYSEATWKYFFENEVQYINRMQRGEWLALFDAAGFQLIEEDSRQVDLTGLRVAERWTGMDRRDLASTVLRVAMRKPLEA
jgi:predicted SAM-dependent methyltransferase